MSKMLAPAHVVDRKFLKTAGLPSPDPELMEQIGSRAQCPRCAIAIVANRVGWRMKVRDDWWGRPPNASRALRSDNSQESPTTLQRADVMGRPHFRLRLSERVLFLIASWLRYTQNCMRNEILANLDPYTSDKLVTLYISAFFLCIQMPHIACAQLSIDIDLPRATPSAHSEILSVSF